MKWGFILSFVLPYFLSLVINLTAEPSQPMDDSISVLQKVDNIMVSQEIVSTHNQNILNLLQERESLVGNQHSSHENELTQTRTIYFGILAVLLSLLFSIGTGNKTPDEKFSGYKILLCLIFVMYLLDVHIVDSLEREAYSIHFTAMMIEKQLNTNPYDSTWYSINYSDYKKQLDKASKWSDRWYRKFIKTFHPSLVQIAYYLIPFTILHFIYFRKKYIS